MNRIRTAVYLAAPATVAANARIPHAVVHGLIALAIVIAVIGATIAIIAALGGGSR